MKKLFVLLIVILSSCSHYPARVENTLKLAGENRRELEKVLNYYKRDVGDSLKYKAAVFLITNMTNNHSRDCQLLRDLYEKIDVEQPLRNIAQMKQYYDSLFIVNNFRLDDMKKYEDLRYITSEYLINNIEKSFQAWTSPWAKDLSFDEFCEYILPYRVGDELLEDWREDYAKSFEYLLDSFNYVNKDSALVEICMAFSKLYYHTENYFYPIDVPFIRPSTLKSIKTGICMNYTSAFVYMARSLGIPVVVDYIPQWAEYRMGHSWASIIYQGKSIDFAIGEEALPGEHLNKFNYGLTKVYRNTYKLQPTSLFIIAPDRNKLPRTFRNPKIIDVTKKFIPVMDVFIENLSCPNNEYVYLSVFDNKNWIPIAWAKAEKNQTTFPDVGYPAVFLPVSYDGYNNVPIHVPILINKVGEIRQLKPDKKQTQTVILKRKFRNHEPLQWLEKMKGGHFELSNNSSFKDTYRIDIPSTMECSYNTIDINPDKSYRYFRFVPRQGSDGAIDEIMLYDESKNKLKGEIIGNYKAPLGDIGRYSMEMAFDGKIFSYAACDSTQQDAWLGLDLGKETHVRQIVFLPRNDDNFIRDNEHYELYYWDNEWVSLGKKIGDGRLQYLEYTNAPSNALFLLRNHTKGQEERIFTYENGEQVWW
jgi:Transglutaminase-like superfamily./F5/8 type C domain.